jgi:hypothetical protein
LTIEEALAPLPPVVRDAMLLAIERLSLEEPQQPWSTKRGSTRLRARSRTKASPPDGLKAAKAAKIVAEPASRLCRGLLILPATLREKE